MTSRLGLTWICSNEATTWVLASWTANGSWEQRASAFLAEATGAPQRQVSSSLGLTFVCPVKGGFYGEDGGVSRELLWSRRLGDTSVWQPWGLTFLSVESYKHESVHNVSFQRDHIIPSEKEHTARYHTCNQFVFFGLFLFSVPACHSLLGPLDLMTFSKCFLLDWLVVDWIDTGLIVTNWMKLSFFEVVCEWVDFWMVFYRFLVGRSYSFCLVIFWSTCCLLLWFFWTTERDCLDTWRAGSGAWLMGGLLWEDACEFYWSIEWFFSLGAVY